MEWYYIFAYSTLGSLILINILSIVFSIVVPVLDKWNKRYLVTLSSFQLFCMATCFIDLLTYQNPNMVVF